MRTELTFGEWTVFKGLLDAAEQLDAHVIVSLKVGDFEIFGRSGWCGSFTNLLIKFKYSGGRVNGCVKYKNGQFVGIERDYFAYFLSKFRKRKYGNNINFYRADFFSKNMSSVDVVFLYLFPAVLNALLPKFEKELKKVLLFILLIFNLKTENQMK
jgi:glycosyltransferase involved in cell wall biosynthesis